jgi:adenosylcobinamide-phosphate synthase
MISPSNFETVTVVTILAFLIDWIIGDPQSWPHPVRLIGKLITFLEKLLRETLARLKTAKPSSFVIAGAFLWLIVVSASGTAVWFMLRFAAEHLRPLWMLMATYLVFSAVCLRDLIRHTQRVERHLNRGDLEGARRALSWIVGRETADLDEAAIRRAEIETLAENFSDGLVAPFFYLALAGPLGAGIYKATNTLDSMVGYKNEKYLYLGRVSARMDDVLNYVPSRLAAVFLIIAGFFLRKDFKMAFSLWIKEGRFHTSPNSGQTEAAMAGALGVYLGGTSLYHGKEVVKPTLNGGGAVATSSKVIDAQNLVKFGTFFCLVLAALLYFASAWLWAAPFGWGLGL